MSNNISSVSEEIEELERQIAQLRHRSLLELKIKLGEARHTVADLEKKIAELTGKAVSGSSEAAAPASGEKPTGKRKRVIISIDQVVQSIKGGATNYRQIARELGCSPITVAKKVEAEGNAAGIRSTGHKASFKLKLV